MAKIMNTFDLVSDDSDHIFNNCNVTGNCFRDTQSSIYKRIMKEWKILQKNLPETIHVQAYERRIDLLRAVIIGASGTPYHDTLFFFDIQFPFDYPNNPPKIHYHSFGYRLNPNLYTNGVVCLSLLNTWPGKKSEKWDPSNSTILQVLVSIQALVLNEKPLFNEPAYRVLKRSLFETKSRAYNEEAFVLTCYSAVNLIRKPPKNFDEFVMEHFRERGCVLLAACKEYANGRVRAGYYGYNGNNNNKKRIDSLGSSTVIKVSDSFRDSLEKAYKILYKELVEKCGASLENFVEELEVEEKVERKKKEERSNGGNKSMLKKAMEKIKEALGLKKKKEKNST